MTLTNRETAVLQGYADGLTRAEIAADLGISPQTVRTHVSNAQRRLRCHSTARAVVLGIATGKVAVHVPKHALDF